MATSRFVTTSGTRSQDLRRVAVGLVVVATHVVLVFVMGKGARHSPAVVEITFFPLPITPEVEQTRPPPAVEELPRSRPAKAPITSRKSDARPRTETPVSSAPITLAPEEPIAPIDWNAQIQASAEALQKRAALERERNSFTGPRKPDSMTLRRVKPPCPFEKCEPTWGADFSVFESRTAKAGRVEKNFEGELIRWTSEHCYQILATDNIMHKAMTKCQTPLRKDAVRGDLFKHMRDVPPPEEKATDVP